MFFRTCWVGTINLLSLACTIALDYMEGGNQGFQQGEDEESYVGLSNSQACGSCATFSLILLFSAL
jgi:hypothetical protein